VGWSGVLMASFCFGEFRAAGNPGFRQSIFLRARQNKASAQGAGSGFELNCC
jgi:hypothetical protein